jgi:hypothetical protein
MLPAVQGRAHFSAESSALLKEKRDPPPLAQIPDVPCPLMRHGPEVVRAVPALTAHDDPVKPVNVPLQFWHYVLEQWLCRDESDDCRDLLQRVHAREESLVLDRDAQPYVWVSLAPVRWQPVGNELGAFGQNLVSQIGGALDDRPRFGSPGVRLLDEEVRPGTEAGQVTSCPAAGPPVPNSLFGSPRTMLNPRQLQFSAKFSF